MTADELARALGGQREGRSWRCPCPVHNGRTLVVTERHGKVLFNCKAGCSQDDVLTALRNLGLFGREHADRDRLCEAERQRRQEAEFRAEAERIRRSIDGARALYGRTLTAIGLVQLYLRSRGITLPIPDCLRFLAQCPHRNGHYYPAMVAPVVGVTGHLVAVHKTFLRSDGSGKADLPPKEQREFCGPVKGAAVRLAAPLDHQELIVAEGIETALSCMQLFEQPAWAALSAPGLAALELPPQVRSVLICADHDENAVGLKAAIDAKERWVRDGVAVRMLWPREVGADFNDVLRSR